jgi:hypothetical protein
MTKEITIHLSNPHDGQRKVLNEAKRFNVLCCGRRWGKSALAVNLLCETTLSARPSGYFAPTYKLLDGTYNECLAALEPIVTRKNEHQFIETLGGGRIEFWTLENELAGRSRKYKRIIIDEAAFAKKLWTKWTEQLRATLSDMKGDAWFLSTPKGKNDFYKLYQKALHEDTWASWQMSTYTNPHIDSEEINDARKDLPELAFSQEYLAEFNDNVANPFGVDYIRSCIGLISTNQTEVFGVDLAKSYDYTVIIGLDRQGNVTYFDRWQGDWSTTKNKLISIIQSTPAYIDSTGVGDSIVEDIQRSCYNVEGFKFTSQSKQQLMESLAQSIQQNKITFPKGIITDELESFEYMYSSSGVKYSAPTGMHDDAVCALALSNYKLKNSHSSPYVIL